MFWKTLLVMNNSGSSRWTHLFLDMKGPQLTEPADNLLRDTRRTMLASVKPGNLRSAPPICTHFAIQAPCSTFKSVCYVFVKLENFRIVNLENKNNKVKYQSFSFSREQSWHIFCVKCKSTLLIWSFSTVSWTCKTLEPATICIAYLAIIGLHKA